MTAALITIIVVLSLLLGYMRYRFVKLAQFTRACDIERIALATELGEAKQELEDLKDIKQYFPYN